MRVTTIKCDTCGSEMEEPKAIPLKPVLADGVGISVSFQSDKDTCPTCRSAALTLAIGRLAKENNIVITPRRFNVNNLVRKIGLGVLAFSILTLPAHASSRREEQQCRATAACYDGDLAVTVTPTPVTVVIDQNSVVLRCKKCGPKYCKGCRVNILPVARD